LGFSKKRRVKFFYDNSAGVYDKRYQEIQIVKYGILLRKLCDAGSLFVDIGCGTGLFCRLLAVRGLRVVGVDFSIGMLREAKKIISLQRVFLICCDSDFLPLRGDIFHGAYGVTLLQNLPDPVFSLSEMVRVCRGGSMLCLSAPSKFLSTNTMKNLLLKAGLRNIEVWGTFGSEDIYGFGRI